MHSKKECHSLLSFPVNYALKYHIQIHSFTEN